MGLSSCQAPARPVCDPPPPVAAIDQRPLGLDGLTTRLEGRPGLSGCSHSPDVCLVPNVPSGAQVRPGEPGTRGINRCQESLTPGYPIISHPNIKIISCLFLLPGCMVRSHGKPWPSKLLHQFNRWLRILWRHWEGRRRVRVATTRTNSLPPCFASAQSRPPLLLSSLTE